MFALPLLTFAAIGLATLNCPAQGGLPLTIQAEAAPRGGPYAGPIQNPFAGVGLYANTDRIETNVPFATIPGIYRLEVTGAGNNNNTAELFVYVGGTSIGKVQYQGTAPATRSLQFTLPDGVPGNRLLKLVVESDNGSWDVFIDVFTLSFVGTPPPPPPPPSPSATPVWQSRQYRNLFKEIGKTDAEIDSKVNTVVQQLFYGSATQRIYYPTNDEMAYIYTADTDDVRSEGMSYGMMICLQLNMKTEFDRLWKYSKTYMQHPSGELMGYFAWKVRPNGSVLDQAPAPDGEEYFAMALLMASKRWSNGTGIYNYEAEANYILDHMLRHRELAGLPAWSGIANLIDPVQKQIVFSPIGQAATFTDPSYHLPHFYELFSRWGSVSNAYWLEVAQTSRQLFRNACHPVTGLAPDYSTFQGAPTQPPHDKFRFDAWRVAQNIALDSYWWNIDPWQRTNWVHDYLGFFHGLGVSTHKNQFAIDGTQSEGDHSPGLVAMNAVAALISDESIAWDFVNEFWNITPTTGTYRYYDGCLYLFGLLNVTGRYRISWDNPLPEPFPCTIQVASDGALSIRFPTVSGISYQLEESSSQTGWQPASVAPVMGDGTEKTFPLTPPASGVGFWRIAAK